MDVPPDDCEPMATVASKLGVAVGTIRQWCKPRNGYRSLHQYTLNMTSGFPIVCVSLSEAKNFIARARKSPRKDQGDFGTRLDEQHADMLRAIARNRSARLGMEVSASQALRMMVAEEHRRITAVKP